MGEDKAPGKGRFGRARLPVALAYILPAGRRNILLMGAGVALAGLVVLASNFWLQDGHLVSSGALSSAHATLESNCAACHTPFQAVPDDKCATCHERSLTSAGTHTFGAHYVYASGDQSRAHAREGELACAACHVEHRGRDVRPTVVASDRCVQCHAYAPFESKHPEFSFVGHPESDSDALKFTHIKHVERVLDETGTGNVEGACLACHKPAADGRGFQPIRFTENCASCHLGPAGVPSADLAVVSAASLVQRAGGGVRLNLGVETLEMVRARRGPGEQWALSMSPAQFDQGGGVVTKVQVVHEDPWITHNLRNLRHILYPSQELADLLVASADVQPRDAAVLYDEALQTLKRDAAGLQGQPQPWLQQELEEITQALAELEIRIADPTTVLGASKFKLDRTPDPTLTAQQVDQINAFATEVAQPCMTCHKLTDLTIARPEADQRVLRRATFDHSAHVIQRGCLQCHTEIPFAQFVDTDEKPPAAVDHAAIQNVPGIEVCRGCHTSSGASTQCRTCHVFHPGSDVRAGLLGLRAAR